MTPRIGRIRSNNALETLSTISIQSKSNELLVFGIYAQGFCFFSFTFMKTCVKSLRQTLIVSMLFLSVPYHF